MIGGVAVNAYVEPIVTLDLDVVVAVEDLAALEPLLRERYSVERFAHSLNVSQPDSKLRVQIQTGPRYLDFPGRATRREALGLELPVASIEDVLRGKIWAATDPARRHSQRLKDELDIARLLEAAPELKRLVPAGILARIAIPD